jgi:hypothetical protein
MNEDTEVQIAACWSLGSRQRKLELNDGCPSRESKEFGPSKSICWRHSFPRADGFERN